MRANMALRLNLCLPIETGAKVHDCSNGDTLMALWHWIVGLFRKKSGDPTVNDESYFDPRKRLRDIDHAAADAVREADRRVSPWRSR